MNPKFTLAGLLLAPVILAGCVVDAADCDPNAVGSVLTSAACSQQGQFTQRQRNIQQNTGTLFAEVERERMALSVANTRIRQLQSQQALTQGQARAVSQQIVQLNGDIDRLANPRNSPVQSAQLRGQIAQRKAAVNGMAGMAVF